MKDVVQPIDLPTATAELNKALDRISDLRAQLDNITDIQVDQARIIERQARELRAYQHDLSAARDYIQLLTDMNAQLRTDIACRDGDQ